MLYPGALRALRLDDPAGAPPDKPPGSPVARSAGSRHFLRFVHAMSFEQSISRLVVLAEALDCISRDQEDVAGVYKRLRFAGVTIMTLAEGDICELHVGLKGTMNALFLKDLAPKTHRGIRGRVEKGKYSGGNCYGYRVVKRLDPGGEPIRGEREIVPDEAEIIRRIFRDFAAGLSPRRIMSALNQYCIPGPDRGLWAESSLRGKRRLGTGILNNELDASINASRKPI